jgi:hypothetical protein
MLPAAAQGQRTYELFASAGAIEAAAARLLKELTDASRPDRDRFVGYDSEFSAVGAVGFSAVTRISLVQLATEKTAYLFHVHELRELPRSLDALLRSAKIVKIGFATRNDVTVMRSTFGIELHVLDVQLILSVSCGGWNWGIGDATRRHCGYDVEKGHDLGERTQWASVSDRQAAYAARDAFACVDVWRALSAGGLGGSGGACGSCGAPPSAPESACLPQPRFTRSEKAAEETAAALAWLSTLPPATSREAMINQLVNSYSPWAKLPFSAKQASASRIADAAWPLRGGLEQSSGPIASGVDASEVARALTLLRQTHPPCTARRKERIVTQLTNSLGVLRCDPCDMARKKSYVEVILRTLVERGVVVERVMGDVELARW